MLDKTFLYIAKIGNVVNSYEGRAVEQHTSEKYKLTHLGIKNASHARQKESVR